MSETRNISDIAPKIAKDIFKHFLWAYHPKFDDNFKCNNDKHTGGKGNKPKDTHPVDIVFYYDDPYLGRTIYLNTDLKSYKKDTINSTKLREAFKSLCMAIDCARDSSEWREKFSVDESEQHEVRGLLFVHNHDNGYDKCFDEAIDKIGLQNLPVAPNTTLHFFGPDDIQRLWSIGNDIIRLKGEEELPNNYTFYYPDLVLCRRQGDVWNQPATIEALTAPYLIIKHGAVGANGTGYVIYYNGPCTSPEEFEYFIDSLSHYQMLESGEKIRIRVTTLDVPDDLKSVFQMAKKKYVKAWGFDESREKLLNQIEIERVTSVTSNYNPGDMGWVE